MVSSPGVVTVGHCAAADHSCRAVSSSQLEPVLDATQVWINSASDS